MFEQIYSSYTLITESGDSTFITWLGMIINIFVAGGTIAAAWMAYRSSEIAKDSSEIALKIHRESEEKRDKEKEVEKIDIMLGFLRGVKAEIYLERHYFKFKSDHMEKNKTPLYRSGKINAVKSFYENNIDKLLMFNDENLILHIQKLFLDIRINYSNLSLIKENAIHFRNLDESAMLSTNQLSLSKIQEECKHNETLYLDVIDGFIQSVSEFDKDSSKLINRLNEYILKLEKTKEKISTE